MMSSLRRVWLGLTVLGAAVPMGFIVRHMLEAGPSPSALIAAWTVNDAATGLGWDLVISAAALIVWICSEVWVRRNFVALWAVPATICVGVSCGLPLYLFLRSRPIM